MHIAALDFVIFKIFGKILCHLLCQSCDKHSFVPCDAFVYLTEQVIDLPLYGTYLNLRIKQTGRAYYLFNDLC